MKANDVLEIVQLLNHNQIEIIIDGGWGVDSFKDRAAYTFPLYRIITAFPLPLMLDSTTWSPLTSVL